VDGGVCQCKKVGGGDLESKAKLIFVDSDFFYLICSKL